MLSSFAIFAALVVGIVVEDDQKWYLFRPVNLAKQLILYTRFVGSK